MIARELVVAEPRAQVLTPGLGPAAERFARTTLRKSAETQRSYAQNTKVYMSVPRSRGGRPHIAERHRRHVGQIVARGA
jgi:hypothetical protein